jgi:mannose-6-phosphate isomerase-like protein (cupin superfamily)
VTEPVSFDLSRTFVHLGTDATVTRLEDFEWSPDYLEGYRQRFAHEGGKGRMVCVLEQAETWDGWERHPAGEEVVVLLSGRVDLVQEIDGAERVVPLEPGQAAVNPAGVWHRAIVHEPGSALFITPGEGTEGRPL